MKIASIQLSNGITIAGNKNSFQVEKNQTQSNPQQVSLNNMPSNAYLVNFKSAPVAHIKFPMVSTSTTPPGSSVIKYDADNELFIENILDLTKGDVTAKSKKDFEAELEQLKKMPSSPYNDKLIKECEKEQKQIEKINSHGLHLSVWEKAEKMVYHAKDNKDHTIFYLKVDKELEKSKLPTFKYSQGEFKPQVTVMDKSLNGSKVKMIAGSYMKSEDGWSLTMPGDLKIPELKKPLFIGVRDGETVVYSEHNSVKNSRPIAFKQAQPNNQSMVAVSTLNLENRTENAVQIYMNAGLDKLAKQTKEGEYIQEVLDNNPTFFMPAGGFGKRFRGYTEGGETKPSAPLPTDPNHRMLGTTLDIAASAGLLHNYDQVLYLSQNKSLKRLDNAHQVLEVPKHDSDGGAMVEALKKGGVAVDKDMVILNADIFTNADVSKVYHALKSLPDAAFVIPYYVVDAERAKSFGLIGTKKPGSPEIDTFVEKPKYTKIEQIPNELRRYLEGDRDYAPESEEHQEFLLNRKDDVKDLVNFKLSEKARDNESTDDFMANPGIYAFSKEAVEVLKNWKDENAATVDETWAPGKPSTGLGKVIVPYLLEQCRKGKLISKETGKPMKAYTIQLQRLGGNQPAFWDDIGSADAFLNVVREVAYQTETNEKNPAKSRFYGLPQYMLKDFAELADYETGVVNMSQDAQINFVNFKQKNKITAVEGNVLVTDENIAHSKA